VAALPRIDDGIDRGQPFEIELDGTRVAAYPGETIAGVAFAAGKYVLRTSARRGAPRGVYCAMGICHECRMIVDGQPNVRSCLTMATPGCRVQTQSGLGGTRT
jgi:D-hydroxyproline dehydrogenase subunit gamma